MTGDEGRGTAEGERREEKPLSHSAAGILELQGRNNN